MSRDDIVFKLTDEMLRQIMPNAPRAQRLAALPVLNATMRKYHINNERRASAWLATLAQESGELKYQEELASGSAYENRKDLGNVFPGDGKKFKGHGRIQITGRSNHRAYTEYLRASNHLPFVDFVKEPHKLANEPYATDAAGWFWAVLHDLNSAADKRQFLATQTTVNGRNKKTGLPNHWAERKAYYERALRALPDDFKLAVEQRAAEDDTPADSDAQSVAHAQNDSQSALLSETPSDAAQTAGTTLSAQRTAPLEGAARDDSPVVVEQSVPQKERTSKSLVATVVAFFATVAGPFAFFKDALLKMLDGADNRAVVIIGIFCAAAVLIYWKYQDRQTKLDVADREHANELTLKTMDIRSDPERINIAVEPREVPAPADSQA